MRALIVSLCLLSAAAPASAEIVTGRAEFEILRNGAPSGRHSVAVSAAAGGFRADSDVEIVVQAGPVTLFRFVQSCDEVWSEGALQSLSCATSKGGRRTRVDARKGEGGIAISGAAADYVAPADLALANWWLKPALGERDMLDPETGRTARVRVTRVGRETLQIGGRAIAAERLRVEAAIAADLWYDAQGRWIGCAFTTRGQRFEYRLVSMVEGAPARA